MDVSSVSTRLASSASQVTTAVASSSTNLTSDFDAFIKMLTAQAKYQDPLDPIDSTEFASQLAQFSMVEQQVQTNNTLKTLIGLIGSSNLESLSGWVGMEARAFTPTYYEGNPIEVSPNPYLYADKAYLVVTDEIGDEVYRTEIEVSTDSVQWNGITNEGDTADFGLYSFNIESYQNEELVLSEPAGIYARIIEAQILEDEVVLILQGGQPILATSVTALRPGE